MQVTLHKALSYHSSVVKVRFIERAGFYHPSFGLSSLSRDQKPMSFDEMGLYPLDIGTSDRQTRSSWSLTRARDLSVSLGLSVICLNLARSFLLDAVLLYAIRRFCQGRQLASSEQWAFFPCKNLKNCRNQRSTGKLLAFCPY
jgi:hypothetical protein